MCGIIGYTGKGSTSQHLIGGLKKLEYRGYDSAGIAAVCSGKLVTIKSVGRVEALERKIPELNARCGIGHTRWATNGKVCESNCHPLIGGNGKIAVVHNGIIENAATLKKMLEAQGYVFESETDTEAAAQLIGHYYNGDMLNALKQTCCELTGSYALAVVCADYPDSVFIARMKSPLAVGIFENESFIASDIAALPSGGEKFLLEDGQVFEIKPGSKITAQNASGGSFETMCKNGYPHYMMKEIHEQPVALKNTLAAPAPLPGNFNEVIIIACGSSYNVALTAKPFFEMRGIRCDAAYASEYRYSPPVPRQNTLAVFVSQSGETADTLAAQEEAKRRGLATLGIVNVPTSALSRACDHLLPTVAGPEIAVATTKGFTSQLAALYRLALLLRRDSDSPLAVMPDIATKILTFEKKIEKLSATISGASDVFFIGRGADYGVSREGALKLKEISYIHAEAYAAGELKHGAISLIEEGTPVIVVSTNPAMHTKTLLSQRTVKARGGFIIAVTNDKTTADEADYAVRLPASDPEFAPLAATVALQILAYYTALERGCDIDKPRNLAKSVTVE